MMKLIQSLFTFTMGLVEMILVFRFILKLLGASQLAPMVNWVYQTSQPLLRPFLFAFPQPAVQGFVLEFTTLFAIFAYAVIGYVVQEVLEIMEKNMEKGKK